jgi:hypothetical protein
VFGLRQRERIFLPDLIPATFPLAFRRWEAGAAADNSRLATPVTTPPTFRADGDALIVISPTAQAVTGVALGVEAGDALGLAFGGPGWVWRLGGC